MRLVLLTALTIIFDGFDNQLLGLALPSIMQDWGLARSAFAPVVSFSYAGMMIALPPREWEAFRGMSVEALAEFLREAANQAWLAKYPRSKHGPKKPRPKRTGRITDHVATVRLLDRPVPQK